MPPALPVLLALALPVAPALLPAPAAAQALCDAPREAAFSPALLRDGDGDVAPGVGVALGICRTAHDLRADFSRSTFLAARVDGAFPVGSLGIPQNLEASLGAGLSLSLSKRNPVDLDDDPDADFYAFNLGFAAAGLAARYEASADFGEQALAGGAELRWAHPAQPLLPSVVVTWDWVRPVRSEAGDALALDRALHSRLGARGYWLVPLGERLEAEVDGAWFRAFGLEEALEQQGFDGGSYLSAALGYALQRPLSRLLVEQLFVEYARGQRPTESLRRQAWAVGVEVSVRR